MGISFDIRHLINNWLHRIYKLVRFPSSFLPIKPALAILANTTRAPDCDPKAALQGGKGGMNKREKSQLIRAGDSAPPGSF